MQIEQWKLWQKCSMPGAIERALHHHSSLYRWFITIFQSFALKAIIAPKPMQVEQQNYVKNAACQELSNALTSSL
jgi:hypothetical protein